METRPLAELEAQAVAGMHGYLTGEPAERTAAVKSIADANVAARVHFWGADGKPDWLGRTHAYRTWVHNTMVEAGVPSDRRHALQSAVRHHLGALLRERLSEDEVAELGISRKSPQERASEARARTQALLALFGPGGAAITDPEDVMSILRTVDATSRRVAPEAVKALTAEQRHEASELIDAVGNRLVAAGARRR